MQPLEMFTLKKRSKFAIVIQAKHRSLPNYDRTEFEGLAKAAGYTIIHFYSQNLKKVNSRYLIGSGKLEEIIQISARRRKCWATSRNMTLKKDWRRRFYGFREEVISYLLLVIGIAHKNGTKGPG